LLVRDRRGLEEARNLTAVVFDKTGTLTRGEFGVVGIDTTSGVSEQEALRIAAAVGQDSEHTIAPGIVRSATERGVAPQPAAGFRAIPGLGVSARVDGRVLLLGGPALIRTRSAKVPQALESAVDQATRLGQTAIFLVEESDADGGVQVLAVFRVADVVRPE